MHLILEKFIKKEARFYPASFLFMVLPYAFGLDVSVEGCFESLSSLVFSSDDFSPSFDSSEEESSFGSVTSAALTSLIELQIFQNNCLD